MKIEFIDVDGHNFPNLALVMAYSKKDARNRIKAQLAKGE